MARATFLLLALGSCASPGRGDGDAPNIVLILADDLGYGDAGCYGAPDVRTPAIDRLASEGVRFTSFYSNGPECTPTRTALMTGRYQQRVGGLECAIGIANVGRYDDAIRLAGRRELGLPTEEVSIARLLKDAGYATAMAGKWHLGYESKFLPPRHGFERSFGPLGGGVDYFHHTEPDGTPMLYADGEPARREGYLTDLITQAAVDFVRRQGRGPFFLYVAYTAPHSPYQGPKDRRDRPLTDTEWNQGTRATYGAMVERMDEGIAAIVRALEETGAAGRTVVVFTSDNGGDPRGRNAPFSGRKGTLYEGGIRVPCVVRWPGVLKPGTTSERLGITMDLTRSLVRAAGAAPPAGRSFDGIDLLREEAEAAPLRPRPLFWRYRRGDATWRAAREGALKYVSRQERDEREEHLFNVGVDPAEKQDLLSTRVSDVVRLKALLAAWEREVKPGR